MSRRKGAGSLGLLLAVCTLSLPSTRADEWKPEEGFTSLFNGKDLTGWTYQGSREVLDEKTSTQDGRIKVEDGAIVMMEKDSKGKGGIKNLFTKKAFPKPFHLKLEFRAGIKADSGVYVRGPQLQVRDFKRRKEHLHLKKFKDDDWNELEVIVRNNVLVASVNGKALKPDDSFELTYTGGKPSAKLNGKEVPIKDVTFRYANVAECRCNGELLEVMTNIPATGGIGLQAEAGKFEFRRVRVKELE